MNYLSKSERIIQCESKEKKKKNVYYKISTVLIFKQIK